VNITSNSIALPAPGLAHYMSSKMGVIGFTRGLANDVAQHGITFDKWRSVLIVDEAYSVVEDAPTLF
ncbi:SDR family NAD(P)-dependent oxidoreductase, partial [Catenulispora sp. NF23]|uniref:SDR family NAD(P)-dependent oxidoreductase n=1 Tax=Catenulispora pinistramenti TaxID=2705254 RepID=UPI001BA6E84D